MSDAELQQAPQGAEATPIPAEKRFPGKGERPKQLRSAPTASLSKPLCWCFPKSFIFYNSPGGIGLLPGARSCCFHFFSFFAPEFFCKNIEFPVVKAGAIVDSIEDFGDVGEDDGEFWKEKVRNRPKRPLTLLLPPLLPSMLLPELRPVLNSLEVS